MFHRARQTSLAAITVSVHELLVHARFAVRRANMDVILTKNHMADAAARALATLGERHLVTAAAYGTRARALMGLGRAVEAEALLRNQLAILADKKARNEDIGEGAALTHELRVQEGMVLAALGRRVEAEAILLEAVPQLTAKTAASARAIRFVTAFYERWNREQPDPGRAAHAAEWRQRLDGSSSAR